MLRGQAARTHAARLAAASWPPRQPRQPPIVRMLVFIAAAIPV